MREVEKIGEELQKSKHKAIGNSINLRLQDFEKNFNKFKKIKKKIYINEDYLRQETNDLENAKIMFKRVKNFT